MQLESSLRDTLAIFLLSRDIGPTFRFCSNGKFHIHRLKLNWNSIISLARYLSFSPFCSPFPNSTHLDLFLMRTYVSTKVGSFFTTAFCDCVSHSIFTFKEIFTYIRLLSSQSSLTKQTYSCFTFLSKNPSLVPSLLFYFCFFFSFLFILAKWNLGCPRATLLTNRGKSLIKRTLHWNR